jgi:2-dehydro-3-deoxygluconokinase
MKICSFGEILLRYALPSQQQWLYGATINAYLGGAEMNVAVALANWGQNVKYCTAMPQHFMAEQILANLTAAQIDCSAIQRFGDKIGVYYVP